MYIDDRVLEALGWCAVWDRAPLTSELIRAAGVDRRLGEDAVYRLVQRGVLVVGPDSRIRHAEEQ